MTELTITITVKADESMAQGLREILRSAEAVAREEASLVPGAVVLVRRED